MKSYADLTTLKSSSYLNITGSGDDTYLRILMQVASRQIDGYCRRFFQPCEETRYYDGAKSILFTDDILSITTLKTDDDQDGIFETSWTAETDYFMYPHNAYPKDYLEISSRSACDKATFCNGIKKGVQITGVFGYGNGLSATPYSAAGINGTVATTTGTTLTLSADGTVKVGHTIRLGTEQMYVTALGTLSATVKRGVNGTTAAVQAAAAISIYEYPEEIMQACLITAMRAWKRKDSAFMTDVGTGDIGVVRAYRGLDLDVIDLLTPFRKAVV